MNVLLIANHLDPGGIAAYCLKIAGGFETHRVFIASGGGAWENLAAGRGIRHFRVPLRTSSELNPRIFLAWRALRRIVKEHRIDLVHDQTRIAQVLGFFLAREFKLPRVTTCHGHYRRRLFRRVFPLWGDRVIAISGAVREHLVRDWGVDPRKIRLVPHGVATAAVGRAPEEAAREPVVIGALGRLSPVKGFHVLIEAFAALAARGLRARLVITGEGPEADRLRCLAREKGVEDKVTFSPAADDPSGFFAGVDIFCAPSIEEGLGFSILEAMAHRKPVIASRVGGIPELVGGDNIALLVEPRDPAALAAALASLVQNAPLRRSLGENGYERVRSCFSAERMIEGTRAVYEELAPA